MAQKLDENEMVRMANLDEAEAPLYIFKELWNRLEETHRLKVVK